MVYSRILTFDSCVVHPGPDVTAAYLEPGKILEQIPGNIFLLSDDLVITVTDGTNTLEYKIDRFLARPYQVVGDGIKFAHKTLKLSKLSITIGVKVLLENLDNITDPALG